MMPHKLVRHPFPQTAQEWDHAERAQERRVRWATAEADAWEARRVAAEKAYWARKAEHPEPEQTA